MNISFIFTKFKIFVHIRIMYDGDTLLNLGGCTPAGLLYVQVFLKRGASSKQVMYALQKGDQLGGQHKYPII